LPEERSKPKTNAFVVSVARRRRRILNPFVAARRCLATATPTHPTTRPVNKTFALATPLVFVVAVVVVVVIATSTVAFFSSGHVDDAVVNELFSWLSQRRC